MGISSDAREELRDRTAGLSNKQQKKVVHEATYLVNVRGYTLPVAIVAALCGLGLTLGVTSTW